jgi:hypothetical protein
MQFKLIKLKYIRIQVLLLKKYNKEILEKVMKNVLEIKEIIMNILKTPKKMYGIQNTFTMQ